MLRPMVINYDLVDMPISKLLDFFNQIKLTGESVKKSERLLKEIISRLEFAKMLVRIFDLK